MKNSAEQWAELNIGLIDKETLELVTRAYEAGAENAEKELVHKPDDPEGITAEELKHQFYGAEFARKEMIEKAKIAFCKSERCCVPIDTCMRLGTCLHYDEFVKLLLEE